MNNVRQVKKGFTLIEVIVSLAIFAIISVGFYGVFSTVFINTYQTFSITNSSFLAQSDMEEAIRDVKTKIENNDHSNISETTKTISIFTGTNTRDVVVYEVDATMPNGRIIETLVSQTRPPELVAPKINQAISITANTTNVINYPNEGQRSNLSINSVYPASIVNESYLIQMLYYWYQSKKTYYISNPPEHSEGFEILPGYTSTLIPVLPSNSSGKFYQLVMTPVGEKGKMGDSVISNAIYISPFTENSSILYHLDASRINTNDTNQVRVSTESDWFVRRWDNMIVGGRQGINQSTASNQPKINVVGFDYGDNNSHDVYALQGQSTSSRLEVNQTDNNRTGHENATIYIAIKVENTTDLANKVLLEIANSNTGRKFQFGTNVSNQLYLSRWRTNNNNASNIFTHTSSQSFVDANSWQIVKLEVWRNSLRIVVNGTGNSATSTSNSDTMYLSNLRINFLENAQIGEIIMFNTQHAAGSESETAVYEYLNNKFRPE